MSLVPCYLPPIDPILASDRRHPRRSRRQRQQRCERSLGRRIGKTGCAAEVSSSASLANTTKYQGVHKTPGMLLSAAARRRRRSLKEKRPCGGCIETTPTVPTPGLFTLCQLSRLGTEYHLAGAPRCRLDAGVAPRLILGTATRYNLAWGVENPTGSHRLPMRHMNPTLGSKRNVAHASSHLSAKPPFKTT